MQPRLTMHAGYARAMQDVGRLSHAAAQGPMRMPCRGVWFAHGLRGLQDLPGGIPQCLHHIRNCASVQNMGHVSHGVEDFADCHHLHFCVELDRSSVPLFAQVVLLSGALEPGSVNMGSGRPGGAPEKLSRIETLMGSEAEVLKTMLARLLAAAPDVVVVEKQMARWLQVLGASSMIPLLRHVRGLGGAVLQHAVLFKCLRGECCAMACALFTWEALVHVRLHAAPAHSCCLHVS